MFEKKYVNFVFLFFLFVFEKRFFVRLTFLTNFNGASTYFRSVTKGTRPAPPTTTTSIQCFIVTRACENNSRSDVWFQCLIPSTDPLLEGHRGGSCILQTFKCQTVLSPCGAAGKKTSDWSGLALLWSSCFVLIITAAAAAAAFWPWLLCPTLIQTNKSRLFRSAQTYDHHRPVGQIITWNSASEKYIVNYFANSIHRNQLKFHTCEDLSIEHNLAFMKEIDEKQI